MSKEEKREGEREEGGRETSAECVVYSLFKISHDVLVALRMLYNV